jgi:hypothetical protein
MCTPSFRAIIRSNKRLRQDQQEYDRENNQTVYFFQCSDGTSLYQFGLMRGRRYARQKLHPYDYYCGEWSADPHDEINDADGGASRNAIWQPVDSYSATTILQALTAATTESMNGCNVASIDFAPMGDGILLNGRYNNCIQMHSYNRGLVFTVIYTVQRWSCWDLFYWVLLRGEYIISGSHFDLYAFEYLLLLSQPRIPTDALKLLMTLPRYVMRRWAHMTREAQYRLKHVYHSDRPNKRNVDMWRAGKNILKYMDSDIHEMVRAQDRQPEILYDDLFVTATRDVQAMPHLYSQCEDCLLLQGK